MPLLGRGITITGVVLVALPIIGGVLTLFDRQIPWVIEFAPTFVLGGIVLFVLGIALQMFGK